MKLDSGTTISHYKILSEIGKGGMGEVYLAQDTNLNRKVAIKFLSEEFGKDSDKLNQFIQGLCQVLFHVPGHLCPRIRLLQGKNDLTRRKLRFLHGNYSS